VRPLIPKSLVSQNIDDTLATGSSITSIPAFETVCHSHDGVVADSVLDRDKMFTLQAPQCFKLGHISSINKRAISDHKVGSFVDMANMMSHYGESVNLTQGVRGNIKITVPDDFDYFNYLVESGKYERFIG
jgi:2-C-methyl-D-erythritol 4-phosphate cytidylyltransferase